MPESGARPAAEEPEMESGADFVKVREPRSKKVIDKPAQPEYIDLMGQLEGLSERQLKIVGCIRPPATHIDDIIEKTGLAAAEVLSAAGAVPGDAEGVGIGLYLTRQIAAGQGGYLKVTSRPGEGSTFSLFLPRAEERT